MIEFLFWRDCPSHERALARLTEAMDRHGIPAHELQVTEVLDADQARRLAFPGSPTIRFDGADLQPPGDASAELTCRLYRLRDGRPSPLPDPDDLADAVDAYATRHSLEKETQS